MSSLAIPIVHAPAATPTVIPNTILERDMGVLLRLWKAMGGNEGMLRDGGGDDVSKWSGVIVKGGRVTKLLWGNQGLSGAIPAEIEALSALTFLYLHGNCLSGSLPPELGNLSSLLSLYLDNNSFSGAVPSSLAKLINLRSISLSNNNYTSDVPPPNIYDDKEKVQAYLATLFRPGILCLLNFGITITKKRQERAGLPTRGSPHHQQKSLYPLFVLLADNEGIHECIMSFLDPLHCCVMDRNNVQTCWLAMCGSPHRLRQGHGDDISHWEGVSVKRGRVTEVRWGSKGLYGTLPGLIGGLDGLRTLHLDCNHNLNGRLPRELSNLTSLTSLRLSKNSFSGSVPSSFAKLTDLKSLLLHDNQFYPNNAPPYPGILDSHVKSQAYLAALKAKDQKPS